MKINSIKENFQQNGIFYSEDSILEQTTAIAYEKKFRWTWAATQLNTFIFVSDFGDEEVTVRLIEKYIHHAVEYSKKHYSGWPKGIQSGTAIIPILISTQISAEAIEYCQKLKSGRRWKVFTVPTMIDGRTNQFIQFTKNPLWGMIYYPHLQRLINQLK